MGVQMFRLKNLNSSELILWCLIPKVSILKSNSQVWLPYMKITLQRKEYGAEDRYSSEPQKVHLTGEFVIVAKFGGHALCHLASRLVNVIRQGGREAD